MANVLKRDKQERVISALVEGSSVRSTERMTGVHRDTIIRLMKRVGAGCLELMDAELRDLDCQRVQVDEIWGYVRKKQRHVLPEDDSNHVGDFWTFVAIDADSKLVPCFRVGKRDAPTAQEFIADLASPLSGRVQVSADALRTYVDAIDLAFGTDVDFGQIVKSYEAEPIGPGRYSPPNVVSADKRVVWGNPDRDHISTAFIERQNLTMRMSIRRLTRLTNAFSKRVENLEAAVALHFGHYNFVRTHGTLTKNQGGLHTTPAMAAGVVDRPWSVGELLEAAL